jgi:hypothetical protein
VTSAATGLARRSSLRWLLKVVAMAVYCSAIFLAFDCVYSSLFHKKDRPARIANEFYDHDLLPNFAGYDTWGLSREKFFTNSLGFKDTGNRNIPDVPASRRVILIGDSFTEGSGLKFEDTYAGLLFKAGQTLEPRIEFLNAAVASYSPVIYYRKIKYLLDTHVRFDEVIVFSDISDVQDEATNYFCIDEHAEFRRYCDAQALTRADQQETWLRRLENHFVVTNWIVQFARIKLDVLTGESGAFVSEGRVRSRAGWTLPGFTPDAGSYDPLGVEGGIKRSIANMQALADLLHAHQIKLTIVVYPWPVQLFENDRDSRQAETWRDFCRANCEGFIDLFPIVFALKDGRPDWYQHLFIQGDFHYSAAGHRLIFAALKDRLLQSPVPGHSTARTQN